MELSHQFDPDKGDKKYKGVVLRQGNRQLGNRYYHKYTFDYMWNKPMTSGYGAPVREDTPRKWVSASEEGPLVRMKKQINDYLAQGYTVHPSGHMRAPGYPYED